MTSLSNQLKRSSVELAAIADTLADSHLRPSPAVAPRAGDRPTRVLVTGGAGFLGVHLLCELLRAEPGVKLVTIVRSKEKLARQFARYGIPTSVLECVHVIEADINSMSPAEFPDVDEVVHSAARIHCIMGLKSLWKDNVQATLKVFSHYQSRARLLLVSTLSVFVSSNRVGVHTPIRYKASEGTEIIGGYAQSKLICERLAERCGANVVRLGLLTGSSYKSCFPENDFFSTFVETIRHLGVHPLKYEDAVVDVTPVDYAAAAIAHQVLLAAPLPVIHVANKTGLHLSEMLTALRSKAVPRDDFEAAICVLPSLVQTLLTFAFFKSEALANMPHYFNVDLFQSTGHSYSIDDPFELSNKELFSTYVSALAGSGRK